MPAYRRLLQERGDFFQRWALTPAAHPLETLLAVEYDASSARFGGYGYLFGYPDYAVNFFVQAADSENFTGQFVERDFYALPTVAGETGRFVWAVPHGHRENAADQALKERAAKILADYRERRARFIGPGKPGVVALLRQWWDNGKGWCVAAG